MKRSRHAMKISITIKKVAFSAIAISANTAFCHDEHAMQGTHWHATDGWGFASMGIVVASAIWMSRGGK